MNINQIAIELFGKFYADLRPSERDIVWAEFEKRKKII